jgi:hypothetical protein
MTPRYMPSVSCRCRFLWLGIVCIVQASPSTLVAHSRRGPYVLSCRFVSPRSVHRHCARNCIAAAAHHYKRIASQSAQMGMSVYAGGPRSSCNAMVHSDNRLASIIAMGIFATGVAVSILLILAHARPFTGEISIKPDALLQVMPEAARR